MGAVLYTILFAALIRVSGFILIVNGKAMPFYLGIAVAFPIISAVIVWAIDTWFGHLLARQDGLADYIRSIISKPTGQTS